MYKQKNNWHIGKTSAPLPPLVKGKPLIGNVLDLSNRLSHFLVESYHEYGSIFRIKLLNSYVTVMAGMDANRFTSKHDEEVFTNEIVFAGLAKEFGSFMSYAPPEEHQYLRNLLKGSYSQKLAVDRIPNLVKVVDDFVDSLKAGDSFEIYPTVQGLVTTQLGLIMLDYHPGDYIQDLSVFGTNAMDVYIFRKLPAWLLKLPTYRKAKVRVYELAHKVLDHIKQTVPGKDRPANGIDKLMASTDIDGKPFSEQYLLDEIIRNYVGGQNSTTGILSLICYTIHKHEAVRDRITQEAISGFAEGIPTFKELRQFEILHKAILETTRLYPIAVLMHRHAAHAFEFAGYRVDAGTEVFNATTVPHFLPEYYPNPWDFNIDREYGTAETFVPYGVGNYSCLGARISDVIVMVTMVALMRRGKFVLDPADCEINPKNTDAGKIGGFRTKLKLIEKYN